MERVLSFVSHFETVSSHDDCVTSPFPTKRTKVTRGDPSVDVVDTVDVMVEDIVYVRRRRRGARPTCEEPATD